MARQTVTMATFVAFLRVMVDTFRPLELGEAGRAVEDPAYAWTWAGRSNEGPGDAVFSNS